MKFKIEQSKLSDCLKKVQAAANAKLINGILGNVKIVAKDGKVSFTTTNLDITLHCTAECDVSSEGTVLIPMARMLSAVSVLPVGDVSIEEKGKNVNMRGGSASFNFAMSDVSLFPVQQKDEPISEYVCSSKVIADLLRKTAYAQSLDETRRSLRSVLMVISKGRIRCVATDGRRLAIAEEEVSMDANAQDASFIIPLASVAVLQKFVDGEGDIRIMALPGSVKFTVVADGYEFYTKIVEDKYPNYGEVIPKSTAVTATISRDDLITCINRVSVMALTGDTSVMMTFSDNKLSVEVNGGETGTATDELPIKYDGEKVEIRFNPKYVLDPVKAATSDEITIGLNNGHSPAVFKGVSEKFMCVLMPLRIS